MKIAKALDMNILVYTRTPKDDEENVHYADLETVLKNSDYISLHCPLTPATRHLINADTLALMKPTAFLINTSRGALIDEQALIQALKIIRSQEPDWMYRKQNPLLKTVHYTHWIM